MDDGGLEGKMDGISEIKLDWGNINEITTSEIGHNGARLLLNVLRVSEKQIDTHVYICSDYRNEILRVILSQMDGVAVYNTAGNVIYNPHNVASVVIDHGSEDLSGCGARAYVKDHGNDKTHELSAIAGLVKADAVNNATMQLEKVPEKERAGILYFDHVKGRIEDHSGNKTYARQGTRLKLLEELNRSLESWYSRGSIPAFAEGQDPEVILLSNLHGVPAGFNAFNIDFQKNEWSGIIRDSLYYAMTHALHGHGSFQNTRSAIMAFQENRGLPQGIEGFLNGPDKKFLIDYIGRGGNIYFSVVGNQPSHKKVYMVTTK